MIDKPSTLVTLLQRRVAEQPHRLAYTFLQDGEQEERSLTYAELDHLARAIGATLQELGASGKNVLLLYPPGLEYIPAFFGCLYSGAVAVPAYPPRLNQKTMRIRSIIADAEAKTVLSTAASLSRIKSMLAADFADANDLNWLATDEVSGDAERNYRELTIKHSDLAFLQYTSGSTGTPKGVMLRHDNLLHNAEVVYKTLGHTSDDKYFSWLPTFHDMGFMAGILQPLYGGFPGIMMSPTSFLQSPLRWLQAISRYGATTSGGPNFAYDLCVRKVKPEQRAALDLSSWSVAFNGAEPVRRETIEKFAETFAPNGFRKEAFYPCYGLAEATLIVSGGLKTQPPSVIEVDAGSLEEGRVVQVSEADGRTKPLVGCGMALGNQTVVIVDPKTARQCASGEIGEIWISGPSVAQGYWNSVDETEQTFRARIADTGEGLFLRTGDLGFIQDGELYITGRLKDLIVIRGRNLYPHDIELSVESSDATLRAGCGAAFSLDVDGEERLFVVQEVDQRQRPDLDQLIPRIRRVIAEDHEVQAHGVILIKAGSIPKTSSGKIQRHACRAAFIANRFDVVAEWINTQPATVNAVETSYNLESVEGIEGWLAALFAARLGVSVEAIDTSRPVIDYGLDSVAAIEVVHVIENELYISLPVTSLLQSAGIAALASEAFARLAEKSDLSTAVSVASQRQRENVCPLSVGQQALWLLYQAAPESAAYNINGAMKIKGPLDAIRLRHAFQTLVDRHSALRAIFETHDGRPRQRILEHAEVDFRQENASTWDDSFLRDRLADEAHFPFALEKTPPFRVRLVKRSDEEHFLLVVAHHIVTDLWSMTLLLNELSTLYEAPASPLELPGQYVDYVHWQESMLTGAEGKRLRSYWLQQLSGELLALNLPVDKPRPVNQSFRGGSISFDLDVELSHRLRALCNKQRVTLYTVLLAAFQVLLHRYTGQDEFLVGSPSAGRTHAGLASLVGYLVNPVALRADLSSDVTFKAFLNQVQRTVLDAWTIRTIHLLFWSSSFSRIVVLVRRHSSTRCLRFRKLT